MKRIEDINIDNKRVIIRCDFNVPISNGIIKDDTKIIRSIKTIEYCIQRASKVIILSHLGRIKTPEDIKNNSLKIICNRLSELLNKDITFVSYDDTSDIDNSNLIMLENVRYFDIEDNKESNEDLILSKYFASFGDVFINDAFGVSHRKCSSLTGISKILPSANGFLVCEEIDNLSNLINNYKKPYTVCLGGKKVSDKIKLIDSLIDKVDYLLISGLMVYTFLKAKGINVGKTFIEEDMLDYCSNLLKKYSNKIVLIDDVYVKNNGNRIYKSINNIELDDECLDIGDNTIKLFNSILDNSKTIFINGPFGLFEDPNYNYGSKMICEHIKELDSNIYAGGGETSYMLKMFNVNNVFLSTGGGATLTYIGEGKLIGVIE